MIKNLEKEYKKAKISYEYFCDLKDRINKSYEVNQHVKVHYEISDGNSVKDFVGDGYIGEILQYGKRYTLKLDDGEVIESDHYLISKVN